MGPLDRRGEESWLSTASERKVVGVAFGIGLFTFCVIGAADWLMYDAGIHPFALMLLSDALAAILAFAFIYRLVRHWHERREIMHRELQIIGDTNHHIRNALELIQLSVQTTQNQQVIAQISVAVDRIQWVLRELLGEDSFCGTAPSQPDEKRNSERTRAR
jgi:hypothetical protein